MAGDSPPCVPVYDLVSLMIIDLRVLDRISMLTLEFSERVTQQGLWYKTTPMSCEL